MTMIIVRIIVVVTMITIAASRSHATMISVGDDKICLKLDAGDKEAQPWIVPLLIGNDENEFPTVSANIGDTLVFNYLTDFHTVNIMKDITAYEDCEVSEQYNNNSSYS